MTRDLDEDPHSYARADEVLVRHIGLRWEVSFEDQCLHGVAALLIERLKPDASLYLDTRDLIISHVEVGCADIKPGKHGTVELVLTDHNIRWMGGDCFRSQADPHLGSQLRLNLFDDTNLVRIHYRTAPSATGLQWLEPEQTAGCKHPFLYSQSQSIHARSWIPCQDSPGIRSTFDAEVIVPEPLRAVMGAQALDEEPPAAKDGKLHYRFVMPQPISPYLLALAVGDLSFQSLGPRSGVWADPTVLPLASSELGDLEHMIDTAEELFGPYSWGHYGVLILPPAFPFGGMENPRLTFATPTMLAGDRSLISLVVHELAHSWSGNLVTNKTWADLWLNEGFTVYAERRIVEALHGRERAELEGTLGLQSLQRQLAEELGERPLDQHLCVDLRGRDPDDNMTAVPYEKGALFLRTLERAYGREIFDVFLRRWFESHAFESVSTSDFESFLKAELTSQRQPLNGKPVPDPDAWIHGEGIPGGASLPHSEMAAQLDQAVEDWLGQKLTTADLPVGSWTAHQWLRFLRAMPDDLGTERMAELDAAFALSESGNSEILDQWFILSIRHHYEPAYDKIESFLHEVGRRKFLTPLYKELLKTDEGAKRAREIYQSTRSRYHAITRRTLDDLMEIS